MEHPAKYSSVVVVACLTFSESKIYDGVVTYVGKRIFKVKISERVEAITFERRSSLSGWSSNIGSYRCYLAKDREDAIRFSNSLNEKLAAKEAEAEERRRSLEIEYQQTLEEIKQNQHPNWQDYVVYPSDPSSDANTRCIQVRNKQGHILLGLVSTAFEEWGEVRASIGFTNTSKTCAGIVSTSASECKTLDDAMWAAISYMYKSWH